MKYYYFYFLFFWKKGPTKVILQPCTLAKSNQISIQPSSSLNSPVGLVKTALYPMTLGETAVNSDLPSCEPSKAPVESGTFLFPALWAAWKEVWTYFNLLIKLYFPDSSRINIKKFEYFCDCVWNYIIWCTIWGLWDYDFSYEIVCFYLWVWLKIYLTFLLFLRMHSVDIVNVDHVNRLTEWETTWLWDGYVGFWLYEYRTLWYYDCICLWVTRPPYSSQQWKRNVAPFCGNNFKIWVKGFAIYLANLLDILCSVRQIF